MTVYHILHSNGFPQGAGPRLKPGTSHGADRHADIQIKFFYQYYLPG